MKTGIHVGRAVLDNLVRDELARYGIVPPYKTGLLPWVCRALRASYLEQKQIRQALPFHLLMRDQDSIVAAVKALVAENQELRARIRHLEVRVGSVPASFIPAAGYAPNYKTAAEQVATALQKGKVQ